MGAGAGVGVEEHDDGQHDDDDDDDDESSGGGCNDGSGDHAAGARGGIASWCLWWWPSLLLSLLLLPLLCMYRGCAHQLLIPAAEACCSPSSVSKLCDCTVFNFAVFAARTACGSKSLKALKRPVPSMLKQHTALCSLWQW